MKDDEKNLLRQAIRDAVARIKKFQDRFLGEQNTKASLIEPILEALGWDVRDPDEVHREYKPTSRDCPVDYALALVRQPKLFVEAKGLGEALGDRKWIAQVLGYATVAGVEWCVLSEGNEWRFYNATAAVDADEKLFCKIRLSEDSEDECIRTLSLISRSNLAENLLDVLWTSHFVDRRVKDCLKRMFEVRDKGLVRLIGKRVPKLQPQEILHSLRRLEVRIDSPSVSLESLTKAKKQKLPSKPSTKSREAGLKAAETRKNRGPASLADLIAAKVLACPLTLFRKYKGAVLEAKLLPDGKVEFQGKAYDSCSTAAENARASIVGEKKNTNGWQFWQYQTANGEVSILDDARQAYLETVSKAHKSEER